MKNMAQAGTGHPGSSSPPPLSLLRSIPYFLLPALVAVLIVWWGIGALNDAGVPLIWSLTCLLAGFFATLGCLAVVLARKESPQRLMSRLWLSPFKASDALLGLIVGFAGLQAYRALQGVTGWLLDLWPYGLPSWMPHFVGDGTFLHVPLEQNHWLILVFLTLYVANVVGEEVWWRGYILPRQVAGMGRNAWIANGLLWSLFHVFQAWDIVSLIPIALGIAFVSQYRKSAWVAIVAHGVLNSVSWIYLIGQMT